MTYCLRTYDNKWYNDDDELMISFEEARVCDVMI